MTLAEELAEEMAQQYLDMGFPVVQVAELLGQQGALWGNDLPGAQAAYKAVARRLLTPYVERGTIKAKGEN